MNESVIHIHESDGLREFEQHARLLLRTGGSISMPRSLSYAGGLGRSLALAQLIATWADRSLKPNLFTTLDFSTRGDHEKFVSYLHGFAAAYFAMRVFAVDGITDIRPALMRAADLRLKAMSEREWGSTSRGPLAELVLVHHGWNEFSSAVYSRNPTLMERMNRDHHGELIVPEEEMHALITTVVKAFNISQSELRLLVPFLKHKDHPLGRVLYESFRNTAEHAYLNVNGQIAERGLRSILIGFRSMPSAQLSPTLLVSGEHPKLSDYFKSIGRSSDSSNRQINVLELSVFDTGPGYADTLDMADVSEAERVSRCFVDHVSSKAGPNSGLGLGNLLEVLTSHEGFLRVRTSTTEAFFSKMVNDVVDSQLIPHVVGNLPSLTGTALTIGIPLSEK